MVDGVKSGAGVTAVRMIPIVLWFLWCEQHSSQQVRFESAVLGVPFLKVPIPTVPCSSYLLSTTHFITYSRKIRSTSKTYTPYHCPGDWPRTFTNTRKKIVCMHNNRGQEAQCPTKGHLWACLLDLEAKVETTVLFMDQCTYKCCQGKTSLASFWK